MYKIAICDSNTETRTDIAKMISTHSKAKELSVSTVESCEELCDIIMNGKSFDLIILAVSSGRMSGIRLGQILRSELNDSTTQILYIADKEECTIQLFELHPLNLIVKPIDQNKLYACIDEGMSLSNSVDGCLGFTANHIEYMIPFREIRFVESRNKHIIVHSIRGDYSFYGKLDEVCCSADFIRIHKSYLVNSCYVRLMKADSVELDCKTALPISRTYRKLIRSNICALNTQNEKPLLMHSETARINRMDHLKLGSSSRVMT